MFLLYNAGFPIFLRFAIHYEDLLVFFIKQKKDNKDKLKDKKIKFIYLLEDNFLLNLYLYVHY